MPNFNVPGMQVLRSTPLTWVAGGNDAFLAAAMLSKCTLGDDAVIMFGGIEWTAQFDTGASGGSPFFLPQMTARLNMNDMGGVFCNATGMGLSTLNYFEAGMLADPVSGLAQNLNNQTYRWLEPFHWLFPNIRVADYRDCWVPIARWRDALNVNITFGGATIGPANTWSVDSASCRLVFYAAPNPYASKGLLSDGARLFVQEQALTTGQTEQSLDVYGRLRYGGLYVGTTGANAATTWDGVATSITCNELGIAAIPAYDIAYLDRWRIQSSRTFALTAAAMTVTDNNPLYPPQSPASLTLFANHPHARISECPPLSNVNPMITGATFPAGSQWLRSQWNHVGDCDRDGAIVQPVTRLPVKAADVPNDLRGYLPILRPYKGRGC